MLITNKAGRPMIITVINFIPMNTCNQFMLTLLSSQPKYHNVD